ncbi:MAG: putative Ribokinase [Parcubacteria group bacterium Greene0416_79]|nr:MAG: putative Ribokinase [Parcubacteria group bacterium Greene0416_79]
MKQLDFLGIGDITTDAFIRLKEASVHCGIDKKNCQLCMRFADKIPYEFVEVVRAVGNSANASVAAARFGLASGLITDIGDDENGKECLQVLTKEKVDTSYATVHKGMQTNYHYVLWYEDERTILVQHQEYPYRLPPIDPPPKWIYVSSLGGNSEQYHYEIIEYLKAHLEVRLAFQPGTFQIRLGTEKLAELYKRTEIFVCNREEAQKILNTSENEIKILLDGIHALGPRTVLITDGPRGAYAFDSALGEHWFQPPYPDPLPPQNRTGAGDAFASTFTSAVALGKSLTEALRWAPINSAYVVQQIGAQRGLLTRTELESYLAAAPKEYHPQRIR